MESMRLMPPIIVVPKYATTDMTIPQSPLPDGTPQPSVFVPKWSNVFLNAMALHHNRASAQLPAPNPSPSVTVVLAC